MFKRKADKSNIVATAPQDETLVGFSGKGGATEFINPKHVFSVRCFGSYEKGRIQPICIMSTTGATIWIESELMEVVKLLGYKLNFSGVSSIGDDL